MLELLLCVLQICLACLLRELAEIGKQLDQKNTRKCGLCGLFVGLLKRGDDMIQGQIFSGMIKSMPSKWTRRVWVANCC